MIFISVFLFYSLLFSEHNADSRIIDLVMLGEYEMLSENYNEAENYLLEALKIDSSSVSIYLTLSEINLINNDLDKYKRNIKRAYFLDPYNIEAGLINSNIHLLNEQYEQSEDILLSLKKKYPSNDNIQLSLLNFFQSTKKWKEFIELSLDIYSNDIAKESFLINALDVSVATDNVDLIVDSVKDLLLRNPESEILLSSYLQLVYNQQLYFHAQETFVAFLKKYGSNNKLEKQLAEIYILQSDFYNAEKILKELSIHMDLDKDLYNLLAITYTNVEEYESLLFYSNKYIKLNPDSIYAHENKVIALLQLKLYNELIEFSNYCKTKFIDEVIFSYVLGDAYYLTKNYYKAEKEYLNALEISGNSRLIMNSLINIYEFNQDYVKSDSLFKVLMVQDDNDALTLNNYAFSLCERDSSNNDTIEYALELSNKALRIEPNNAAFLDTMGWIYYRMGNYNLAEHYIKDSIDIDDTNSIVLEHLADVYVKKNNINYALKYYKLALLNDPENSQTKLKIKKYEKN